MGWTDTCSWWAEQTLALGDSSTLGWTDFSPVTALWTEVTLCHSKDHPQCPVKYTFCTCCTKVELKTKEVGSFPVWKTMAHLSCISIAMVADDCNTRGQGIGSQDIYLFLWDILVSAPERVSTTIIAKSQQARCSFRSFVLIGRLTWAPIQYKDVVLPV